MELWNSLPQYEGIYEVSTHGRVKSLARKISCRWGCDANRKERILKAATLPAGYKQVGLTDRNGRKSNHLVHSLVMLAFVGDRPFGYEVCHGDGDPANNNRKNLRYDTPAGNAADKRLHGTNNEGDTNPRANFTAEQVMGIYQRCKRGESQTVVADELGISSVTVNHIATGRTWGTVTGAVWVRVKLRMTPLLVRQIDQLQQSGKTLQEIADELNLSKPTVFRHSKGKSKLIKEGSLCI